MNDKKSFLKNIKDIDIDLAVIPTPSFLTKIDISNYEGFCCGRYNSVNNTIFLINVESRIKGFVYRTLTQLCKQYKTNKVVFCYIINSDIIRMFHAKKITDGKYLYAYTNWNSKKYRRKQKWYYQYWNIKNNCCTLCGFSSIKVNGTTNHIKTYHKKLKKTKYDERD